MLYTWRQVCVVVVLVVVGVLGWRFYGHAYQAGIADCRAVQATLADAAAQREREAAKAQSDRDRAAARADAAARVDQLRRRHALELDLARRLPGPECSLDDQSLRLLNDTVRAGNSGSAVTAGSVPGGVSTGAGAE